MKVILLQDVAKIGRRYDVAEVPTGHALNMLIPKGLAEAATAENIKKIKARADKAAEGRAVTEALFSGALEKLEGKGINVSVQANEKGHLFEALKASAIAEAVVALGAEITEEQISIESPIKEIGEHTIVVKAGDKESKLTVNVIAA